jgi:23S rRNA (cytosine1962-C5)-methyltransferase
MSVAKVILQPRKARPFFGRHPWVLDSAIGQIEGEPRDGDEVELFTAEGQFVARGLFSSASRIRVRLYTWQADQPLDETFWRQRLESAVRLRKILGYLQPGGAERLVFSEADGLSGLIVDRYRDYLAIEFTSLGMALRQELLVGLLAELLRPRGMVLRRERGTARGEGAMPPQGPCWGQPPDGPVFITEHGVRYGVDVCEGQKTGFFLDQRENRLAAARYMHGRRLLDVCCYSGAFALVCALRGEAREVLAIDTSARAIALARANAELNGVANVRFETADAFSYLPQLAAEGQRFDAVILDPPKFAQRRESLEAALRAYYQLNRMAVDLLAPDGVLVTCSCSGYVSREDFLHVLAEVAQRSGRTIQVLEQRGAAPDHPTSASCLESEYLKCFICRVE